MPLLFIQKSPLPDKLNNLQIVINYRSLNKITIKYYFLLPILVELNIKLEVKQFFSKLYLDVDYS
jgi:hypothetical protein